MISLRATVLILLSFGATAVSAGPDWQTNPICQAAEFIDQADYDRCRSWIANVKQPVVPGMENQARASCCSEADAYEADDFVTVGESYYAIITRQYPAVPIGTRIFIPTYKINKANQEGGNPSNHGVVFLSATVDDTGQLTVLCYFAPYLN